MIQIISEEKYRKLQYPILFNDEQTDRIFATLSYKDTNYKFAWQSNNITPCVIKIRENILAIGVDQNFIVVNFDFEKILIKYRLDYFLYDIRMYNDFIYVLTELEILRIEKRTMELVDKYDLPDILENIEFNDYQIIVKCMDGEVINLPIN